MNSWLKKMGLIKLNYKGEKILTSSGIIFIIGSIIVWVFYLGFNWGEPKISIHLIFLSSMIGSVSLIDDQIGGKEYQGFKGHFFQLFSGKLTTGALKAIVSFLAVLAVLDWKNSFSLNLINLGLILFMTNLLNLLDLRPGRTIKFFLLFSIILIILLPSFLIYFLPIYLLIIFYLPFELEGKVMLGDIGANVLGVVLGYGYSNWPSLNGRFIIFLILALLNIFTEKYSFTKIIEKNRLLKWFDGLGREE